MTVKMSVQIILALGYRSSLKGVATGNIFNDLADSFGFTQRNFPYINFFFFIRLYYLFLDIVYIKVI